MANSSRKTSKMKITKKKQISKEILELAEKIKKHRTSLKKTKEFKIQKGVLKKQVEELEKSIKILKIDNIKKNKLRGQIKELEVEKKNLKLELEKSKGAYTFLVTKLGEEHNTVHGEIKREIEKAQKEILLASPWITYIVDELSNFKRKSGKKINVKIITRLMKEDIDKGITNLEKLRALKEDFGAEIRYNNDLHAKMVVVDNSVAIISSANLTKKGLSVNYEAGVCVKDKEMADKVAQFFNDVWKESKPLTQQTINNVLQNKKE